MLLEKSLDRTVTIGLLLVLGVIPNPSAQFERITNVVQIFNNIPAFNQLLLALQKRVSECVCLS